VAIIIVQASFVEKGNCNISFRIVLFFFSESSQESKFLSVYECFTDGNDIFGYINKKIAQLNENFNDKSGFFILLILLFQEKIA
jgi:hypothetical protein